MFVIPDCQFYYSLRVSSELLSNWEKSQKVLTIIHILFQHKQSAKVFQKLASFTIESCEDRSASEISHLMKKLN